LQDAKVKKKYYDEEEEIITQKGSSKQAQNSIGRRKYIYQTGNHACLILFGKKS